MHNDEEDLTVSNDEDDYSADLPPSIGHNSLDTAALDDIPDDAKLGRVRLLAKLQIEREEDVKEAEKFLKIAKERLSMVADRELPNLLSDLGLKKIPLTNGATVVLKTKQVAYVKVENQQDFYTWMNKHGFGSLIKRKVTTEFPRGASDKAGKLLGYLKRWYKDFIVTDSESIHGGTLNAWASEFTENNLKSLSNGGKEIVPPDYVKISEVKSSFVVLPKGKTVEWN